MSSPEHEIEESTRPNKSQLKREMQALKLEAEKICHLKQAQLETLDLGEQLNEAVKEYKRLGKKDAQNRQLQFITRQLSIHPQVETILESLNKLLNPKLQQKNATLSEDLYEQLLRGNQEAIDQLLKDNPDIERQQFLQTLRNAQKENKKVDEGEDNTKKQRNKLKKMLRKLKT